MQQYAAMNAIKNLVDSRYHRLIGDVHVIKASKIFFVKIIHKNAFISFMDDFLVILLKF